MRSGHPVDHRGRVLPECSWPPERHAPGTLEIVRRFCNTTNLESGADRLRRPQDFSSWLAEQHRQPFSATESELADCRHIREVLRAAATAHRTGEPDADALSSLQHLVSHIDFGLHMVGDELTMTVDPGHAVADRFVGALALAVLDARTDSTWQRLKTCRNCRWVVYDHSKNRSSQWCSMSACGGRSKVRHHRDRRRRADADPD